MSGLSCHGSHEKLHDAWCSKVGHGMFANLDWRLHVKIAQMRLNPEKKC
jgi:hypothetical protein